MSIPTSPTPSSSAVGPASVLRAAIGACLGLMLTGFVTRTVAGSALLTPLIAPMGASAVLLFAVPLSPLARPWPAIGGNTIAALIGVTVAGLIEDRVAAASVAVAATIAVTASLRCVHPPAGAVALTTVVGGPAVTAAGYGFAAIPVLLNTLLLVGAAHGFHAAIRAATPR
jgi:CBS domain-containing membrane protein